MAGDITLGHDRCINDALEDLRCEPRSIQVQVSVFPNFCAAHGIDAGFHSNLGRTQRIVDRAYLLLRFEFALRPERIGFRFDSDLHLSKLIGETNGERRGYINLLDLQVPEDLVEDLRRSRKLGAPALPSFLVLRVSEYLVDCSLAFRSIKFQIIHDQVPLAAFLDEDKWVRCEEASCPEHVRVSLACAVDKASVRRFRFQHVILIEMSKTAGIIVIGNEILSGKTRDENSLYLARELRDLGVDVRKISVIADELLLIADEVRNFSNSYDYVFTTGGVGPTHDDLTMEGIANAFGRHIHRNAEIEASIRHFYSRELIDGNLRMADVPEGARLVGGKGMWFPVVAVENVYVFPGVPEILRKKFERIKETFREAPFYLREIYLKADEGQIAATLHRALQEFPGLLLGSYPYFDNPVYSIKLTLESKDLSYLERAHATILSELARIDLYPLNVGA